MEKSKLHTDMYIERVVSKINPTRITKAPIVRAFLRKRTSGMKVDNRTIFQLQDFFTFHSNESLSKKDTFLHRGRPYIPSRLLLLPADRFYPARLQQQIFPAHLFS